MIMEKQLSREGEFMVMIKENMTKIDKDFSSQQARISMIKTLLDLDHDKE